MKFEIDYYMGTATFFVDVEASSNKSSYKGQFKVKCILSPLEYINADANYRELLGKTNPQYASDYVSQLAYALSQLRFRIMECPSWYNKQGDGVRDDKVLLDIFDKAVECEQQYREGIVKRFKSAQESVRSAVDRGELGENDKTSENEDMDELEG